MAQANTTYDSLPPLKDTFDSINAVRDAICANPLHGELINGMITDGHNDQVPVLNSYSDASKVAYDAVVSAASNGAGGSAAQRAKHLATQHAHTCLMKALGSTKNSTNVTTWGCVHGAQYGRCGANMLVAMLAYAKQIEPTSDPVKLARQEFAAALRNLPETQEENSQIPACPEELKGLHTKLLSKMEGAAASGAHDYAKIDMVKGMKEVLETTSMNDAVNRQKFSSLCAEMDDHVTVAMAADADLLTKIAWFTVLTTKVHDARGTMEFALESTVAKINSATETPLCYECTHNGRTTPWVKGVPCPECPKHKQTDKAWVRPERRQQGTKFRGSGRGRGRGRGHAKRQRGPPPTKEELAAKKAWQAKVPCAFYQRDACRNTSCPFLHRKFANVVQTATLPPAQMATAFGMPFTNPQVQPVQAPPPSDQDIRNQFQQIARHLVNTQQTDGELTIGKQIPNTKTGLKKWCARMRAIAKTLKQSMSKRRRTFQNKRTNTLYARVSMHVAIAGTAKNVKHKWPTPTEDWLTRQHDILLDGGASVNIAPTPDVLIDVHPLPPKTHVVRDANGRDKSATHKGTLVLHTTNTLHQPCTIRMHDVWVVPGMQFILSENTMREQLKMSVIKPYNAKTFLKDHKGGNKIVLNRKADDLDYLQARLIVSQTISIAPVTQHTRTAVHVQASVQFISRAMQNEYKKTVVEKITEHECQQLLNAENGDTLKHGFIPSNTYDNDRKYLLAVKFAGDPDFYRVRSDSLNELMMLHAYFGHASIERIARMAAKANIKFAHKHVRTFCDACNYSKAKTTSEGTPHATRDKKERGAKPDPALLNLRPFERMHADLAGPYPKSLEGFRWELQVVDRKTRTGYWYGLRSPKEVEDCIEDLIIHIQATQKQTPRSVSFLQSHAKGEEKYVAARDPRNGTTFYTDQMPGFKSASFRKMLQKYGCLVTHSPPYLQRFDGLVERRIACIAASGMCMRASTNCPVEYWAHSHKYATYLNDFLPTKGLDGFISPFQAREHRAPNARDFNRVRLFGGVCVVKDPLKAKQKPKGKVKHRFMGVNPRNNYFLVYNPETKKLGETLSVSFKADMPTANMPVTKVSFPPPMHDNDEIQPNVCLTHTDIKTIQNMPATTPMHDKICKHIAQTKVDAYQDPQSQYDGKAMPEMAGPPLQWRRHKELPPSSDITLVPTHAENPADVGGTPANTGGIPAGVGGTGIQAQTQDDVSAFEDVQGTHENEDEINVDLHSGVQYERTTDTQTGQETLQPTQVAQVNHILALGMERARLYAAQDANGQDLFLLDTYCTADDIEKAHVIQQANSIGKVLPSWTKAKKTKHKDMFDKARHEEVAQLYARGTFRRVRMKDLPRGTRLIPSSMNFVLKGDENGKMKRARARWVLGGHRLIRGVHVHETAATTPSATNFKIHVAMAAANKARLRQADIKGAFLHAPLPNGEICAMLPPRDQPDLAKDEQGYAVCYINEKCQYGHPAASREWQIFLNKWLTSHGWKQVVYNPDKDVDPRKTTPTNKEHTDECTWERGSMKLLTYVDDLLYFSTNQNDLDKFERELEQRWGDVRATDAKMFLGCNIDRQPDGGYAMSMRTYIENMAKNYSHLQPPQGRKQPMSTGYATSRADMPTEAQRLDTKKYPMRSLVGAMIYCLMCRYDVAYTLSQLARVQDNPSHAHYKAALHCLSYLSSTRQNVGATYSPKPYTVQVDHDVAVTFQAQTLVAFSDSSHADEPAACPCDACVAKHGVTWQNNTSRKTSMSATLMLAGGPVEGWSKSQTSRDWHSTEAELKASAEAAKRIIVLRKHMEAMGNKQETPTPLYVDNSAALTLCLNHIVGPRTRHLENKIFSMRELHGTMLDARKIRTTVNYADVGTKALPATVLEAHIRSYMHVRTQADATPALPTKRALETHNESNTPVNAKRRIVYPPVSGHSFTLPGQPFV